MVCFMETVSSQRFSLLFTVFLDVYLDTMGYAFTLPLFRYIGGCRVGCYTHYPTISTDMLRRVSSRTAQYNNSHYVARSPFLTGGKIIYYKMFAWVSFAMPSCSYCSVC